MLGCGSGRAADDKVRLEKDGVRAVGSAGPIAAKSDGEPKSADPAVVMDLLKGFDACTLGHRGVLLDLGDATTRARVQVGTSAATHASSDTLEVREHEGASWVVLRERALGLSFVSPTETRAETGVVVEARVRGGAARNLSVYLNGKPLGSLPLARGEVKVVSLRAPGAGIARGANELSIRAGSAPKGSKDQLAEIDWVHVGPYDGEGPYSAPTRSDALTTVTLGGVARRGLSLRAPGFARCAGFVPSGAVLEGYVGVAGGGEAEVEVRVLVDRSEPRVVGSVQLGAPVDAPGPGGAPASGTTWRPLALPLGDVGSIAAVELVAKTSAKGARVVFAEPRVVLASARRAPSPPPARGVLLVVLGGTPRRALSPWGGTVAAPELAQLAASGLVFDAHRAPTSYASGSVASMLTGLSPRRHGITDAEAAIPAAIPLLAEAMRHAGVMTAMFTANPTTSAAYGFARGWETFTPKTPLDDEPATSVFDHAARWLDAHKQDRFFVVVHARGGHPPWDLGNDQMKDLPPAGYAGSLDAKHAAEMLAKARKPGSARLTEADRTRAFALHERALGASDEALGRLLAQLHAIGREADTAVIVTGDVGFDAGAPIPFLEGEALDEATLALPLVVKAPGVAAARVQAPTSSVDLARTMLEALALTPPSQLEGASLWSLLGGSRGVEAPSVAAAGARFSARWGGFVLAGTRDRESRLCNLTLEPDCASDVRASHPLAAEVMHAVVHDELARARDARRPTVTGAPSASGSPPAGANIPGTASSTSMPSERGLEPRENRELRENRGGFADPAVAAALKAWGR
jgi:arylsulfatase A-like enzyme